VSTSPRIEVICNDLLIGDVETVAEKLVAEIHASKPVHVCFSFKVGNTPHAAAMRSMELMIGEVKPRVEKALGSFEQVVAERIAVDRARRGSTAKDHAGTVVEHESHEGKGRIAEHVSGDSA
jgi:hypothetical protein